MRRRLAVGITIGMAAALSGYLAQAQAPQMGFFITSAGPGKGADLGGLAGADAHCQKLAAAAGAGGTDVARLSQHDRGRQPAGGERASDRIGSRPVEQRQGRRRGGQRRRSAQRQQQAVEGKLAHREGRGGQRPRRHAEPARHPHRQHARRHRLEGAGDTDLHATGPAAARAARSSVITIGRAAERTRRRGTRRTRRAAAARRTCAAPAATGCSTASRRSSRTAAGIRFGAFELDVRSGELPQAAGDGILRHNYQQRFSTRALISKLLGGFSPKPSVCIISWMTSAST